MKGLVHGNKGKPSVRRIDDEVKEAIKNFYQEQYRGFNISHFTEKLKEKEGINISRKKVREILLKACLYKRRNSPEHRAWREPMPKEGMISIRNFALFK